MLEGIATGFGIALALGVIELAIYLPLLLIDAKEPAPRPRE